MPARRRAHTSEISPEFIGMMTEKLDEALRERGRVNILIAGKTGVGKSTLINAVFKGTSRRQARDGP